ncbi:hypothetical protein DERP_011987 [Dermatophagoides pteronyssinus]|uniref:Uncharacterized protein n=1 Tax=Dermatophagoides pteronyssinus TaxID=6956 RepID=A0ABQ8IVK5_DERPT|nr:hypothetical protein DERP_011987 [Dermatophagoides pteronyssinus]
MFSFDRFLAAPLFFKFFPNLLTINNGNIYFCQSSSLGLISGDASLTTTTTHQKQIIIEIIDDMITRRFENSFEKKKKDL